MGQAAGVMCVADGKVLLVRRAGDTMTGMWAFPAGHIEKGETAKQAALRELFEETGQKTDDAALIGEKDDFSLFLQRCDVFQPQLNEEHDGFVWASASDLPQPLHPGIEENLKYIDEDPSDPLMATDVFALDESVRTYDQDGRLRISISNISKANVCEYLGREIPDWEALGLQADKFYKLYRDPAELKKAAESFNGVPILNVHAPATAWDHPKGKVIGATGTDAVFAAPYLRNSLFIWTKEAIEGIESNEQRELSSAYRYTPDMTPGATPEGESYDGVMRNIKGNHVAVVPAGRAGPDVIVGDSQLEINLMATKSLSNKAVLAKGMLMASLQPMLAADSKLNLDTLLNGVTNDNWKDKKASILDGIKLVLAKDADLGSVVKMLDLLDGDPDAEMGAADPGDEPGLAPEMEHDPNAPAVDETPVDKVVAFLRGKISDEDCVAIANMLSPEPAAPTLDADPDEENPMTAKDEPVATPGAPAAPGKKDGEELVSKTAMDSAVKAAQLETRKATIAQLREINEAHDVVRPYVGKLAAAFDSAEEVYKAALDAMKIDTKKLHPSAYRAVLEAQHKPGQKLAEDHAAVKPGDTFERYPGLKAIRTV